MSLKYLIAVTPLVLLITQGCSNNSSIFSKDHLPLVHKVDVQQGNVITQDMLAKLETGMTKKKVRFIMGTPVIADTFHSNRWDYIYTYKEGRETREQRRITLFFKNDLLARVDGDIIAAQGEIQLEDRKVESVEVPAAKPAGIFSKVKDKLSFDEDKPRVERKKAVKQPRMKGEAAEDGEEKESFLGRLFDGDDKEEDDLGPNDPYLNESDDQIDFDDDNSERIITDEDRVDPDLDPNNPYLNEADQQIDFDSDGSQRTISDEDRVDPDLDPNNPYLNEADDIEYSEETVEESGEDAAVEDDEPGLFGKLWDKMTGDDADEIEQEINSDIDPDADPNDPYLNEK